MKNIFILFFLLVVNIFGYVNINPVTFDRKIDGKGEVQEYTLYNPTQNTLKYQLYLTDEEIEKSMKNWIEIFPTTVTLKPGRSGKFKVFVKAPKGAPRGEYLVTVGVKEIALPKLNSTDTSTVQILTHLKMDLAGYIGDLDPKIFLKDFSVVLKEDNLNFYGQIANVGERRGTLDFYLTEDKGKNSVYVGNLRLLKGEKLEASKLNQKLTKYDNRLLKGFSKYNTLIVKDSLSRKILYETKIK
ncbi:COG1470 family protein [Cetobacterium sp.]|uniref:COG1470 family protein n=1 Tax=Cetobacterium sp. TaxID=2071632 RepID=UPI003F2B5E51